MKDLGGINSLERLKLRCSIDPITDCWLWSMSVYQANGHPIVHARFPWSPDKKKKTTGRRAAVEFKTGKPMKSGWYVWGTCGTTLCCNPEHAQYGDAEAYGMAMREFGWHKGSTAHIRANRQMMRAKRKLTDEQADEIRRSPLSIAKLADIYGLAKSGIADIKGGRRYKETGVPNSSVFAWRPAA